MSKYMVCYNTTSAMRAQMAQIPPEQAAAGMQEWMTWGERVGDRLVDMGSPPEIDGDADVQVSGYSVIDADSEEQLNALLPGTPPHRGGRDDLDAAVYGDARHVTRSRAHECSLTRPYTVRHVGSGRPK